MENLSTWQTTKVDWIKTHNDEYSVCGAEGKDPFPIGRPLIHVCWLVVVYELQYNIFLNPLAGRRLSAMTLNSVNCRKVKVNDNHGELR